MRQADEVDGKRVILGTALLSCRDACLSLLRSPFHLDDYWSRRVEFHKVRRKCNDDVQRGSAALDENRYEDFLRPVLKRLTVLRNQVAHGCVTYGPSSRGFEGLEDGLKVLRALVPAFHSLAEKRGAQLHGDLRWDPLPYPRLESGRHRQIGSAG